MLVGETNVPRAGTPAGPNDGFYRQCPECDKLMNRRNFGRRSGVVIDTCKDHGMWFDAQELSGILRWIRAGGETRAHEREADEERHRERQSRLKVERPTQIEQRDGMSHDGFALGSGLGGFLGQLFDL